MMWNDGSELFEIDPREKIFEAQARLDAARRTAEEPKIVLVQHPQPSWLDRLLLWVISWFERPTTVEDSLAEMVLVMLESKPDTWKFSAGDTAKFEDMHVIINFPSWKKLTFNIRTMDQKTAYSGVVPSRAKRRELYAAVIRCRDHKILSAMAEEIKNKVLLITDQREGE